jgi:hypothetical protein
MPTVGVDCQIILDGQGYLVAPHTYQLARPRVRKSTITLTGAERVVDLGPGKHVWKFIVLALNDLSIYGGAPLGQTGEAIRDALEASYAKPATVLTYVDPASASWQVRFDGLVELLRDPRSQLVAPGYLMAVELVEA